MGAKNKDLSFEWGQFAKLGDMIGMGEHLQEGGEWITKEYKYLQSILLPDETREQNKLRRQQRARQIDVIVKIGLDRGDRCKCTGELEQFRKGSYIVVCKSCGARYRYKAKKGKK